MAKPSADAAMPATKPTRRGSKERKEHLDEMLDEALKETFPASDPIAVDGSDDPVGPMPRHREKREHRKR